METVKVDLKTRSYDIHIGPGLLAEAGAYISPFLRRQRVAVVTDSTVADLHLEALREGLLTANIEMVALTLPAGEQTKNWQVLGQTVEWLLDQKIERNDIVIALGGGVIGDLVGFAAAILRRGVQFIQIPTSLLAQVDSSVGGKTGVNAAKGKNLIGAFYQPKAVLADTALLASLPPRELRAGFAEVIKYGLLGDRDFFEWLEANGKNVLALDEAAIAHAVYTSCTAKARIVEADEREAGQRALLNLGHTFAHAFEAEAHYDGRLLHGEAVAAGMGLAFDLSVALNICNGQDARRCKAMLEANGLPSGLSNLPAGRASADTLLSHMKHDKKVKDGTMHFVLVRSIGDAFVSGDVPPETVLALLE